MDAKELMIGDWVVRESHKKTPQQVIGIGDKGVTLKLEGGWCGEAIDLTEPIPLTPEILEKNGFTPNIYQINDVYGTRFNLDEYYCLIFFNSKNGASLTKYYTNKSCFYITTINYVHELQHALRLAGINKEIVL